MLAYPENRSDVFAEEPVSSRLIFEEEVDD
jgi:hypothetical protein